MGSRRVADQCLCSVTLCATFQIGAANRAWDSVVGLDARAARMQRDGRVVARVLVDMNRCHHAINTHERGK